MALVEWGLNGDAVRPAGRLGRAQIGLPFLGGVLLMIGLLADVDPLPPSPRSSSWSASSSS
jgi:hypothetical protein